MRGGRINVHIMFFCQTRRISVQPYDGCWMSAAAAANLSTKKKMMKWRTAALFSVLSAHHHRRRGPTRRCSSPQRSNSVLAAPTNGRKTAAEVEASRYRPSSTVGRQRRSRLALAAVQNSRRDRLTRPNGTAKIRRSALITAHRRRWSSNRRAEIRFAIIADSD